MTPGEQEKKNRTSLFGPGNLVSLIPLSPTCFPFYSQGLFYSPLLPLNGLSWLVL